MKSIYAILVLVFAGIALVVGCAKNYTLVPIPVPTSTPTPTVTNTPCGYPGNTCTWTSTPTWTYTPTPTFTGTPTFTPTPTPPPLNPPSGFVGWYDLTTHSCDFIWIIDPSTAVTGYQLWGSPTGVAGSYSLAVTYVKGVGDFQIASGTATSFNYYYYAVATGTQPTSSPSNVVHCVSGTTSINDLSISVSSSTSPTVSVTGSVSGAYSRMYGIPGTITNSWYWVWSDNGTPLTTSANYGQSGGLTYVPVLISLPSATSNIPVTVRTFNNQNWNIDVSYSTFNTP